MNTDPVVLDVTAELSDYEIDERAGKWCEKNRGWSGTHNRAHAKYQLSLLPAGSSVQRRFWKSVLNRY
jgi:hypothetical protein